MNIRARKPEKLSIIPKFLLAIGRRDGSSSRTGLHVTALSYDCNRRNFFYVQNERSHHGISTMLSLWIGHKLHETQVLKEHEIPLELNGILGQADEYENGILLEKKTCTDIPQYPYDNHIRQAEYYSLMLQRSGRPVHTAFILYIDVHNKTLAEFRVHLRPFEMIEKELLHKAEVINEAVEKNIPPPRQPSWLCDYCPFASLCFATEH